MACGWAAAGAPIPRPFGDRVFHGGPGPPANFTDVVHGCEDGARDWRNSRVQFVFAVSSVFELTAAEIFRLAKFGVGAVGSHASGDCVLLTLLQHSVASGSSAYEPAACLFFDPRNLPGDSLGDLRRCPLPSASVTVASATRNLTVWRYAALLPSSASCSVDQQKNFFDVLLGIGVVCVSVSVSVCDWFAGVVLVAVLVLVVVTQMAMVRPVVYMFSCLEQSCSVFRICGSVRPLTLLAGDQSLNWSSGPFWPVVACVCVCGVVCCFEFPLPSCSEHVDTMFPYLTVFNDLLLPVELVCYFICLP
jgi:hypothetical protein